MTPVAEPLEAAPRERKRSAAETAKFLTVARARFEQADIFEKNQRAREQEDLKCAGGDWWPKEQRSSRAGQQGTDVLPPIPARPCLDVDMVRDSIRHVLAEEQTADLGIEIVAADDFGGPMSPIADTELKLREGLIRKIQRDSQARDARAWAFDRGVKCGRGYYAVMTRFAQGKTWDQEVYVEEFYNQATALLDIASVKVDGSDAEWGFYGTTMSWDAYKAQYPNRPTAKLYASDDEEWRACGDEAPDWFVTTDNVRYVRVMNYYYTTWDDRDLLLLRDGRAVFAEDLPERPAKADVLDSRPYPKKAIQWAKIDGANVLEETRWPGQWIPILKYVGERVQPYDKEMRCQGMIRPARDAQYGFVVTLSTEVEMALLAPRVPVVGVAGQFEGFEAAWQQANIRNIGPLEYNATVKALPGVQLDPPGRMNTDMNAPVQMWDGLRQVFTQAIKSTTGIPDPTLGNVDPSLRSGRAIRELVENAKRGTSGYMANLVKTVTHEARIINDLLYPIYGQRPGRILQMMTGKHEAQGVILGQHFTRDEKQRPVPVQAGQPPPEGAEHYTLTKDANFNIAIRVSKDFDTARQEQVSDLGEVIALAPEAMLPVVGDLYFANQDGPGHEDVAERMKLILRPEIQAMLNGQQPQSPQVQALQMENQQLKQVLATEQAKQQAALEKAKIDQQTALAKAAQDADTRIRVAGIGAEASVAVADIKAQNEDYDRRLRLLEILITGQKEARLEQEQRTHEHQQTSLDRAHEVGVAAMEHAHAKELASHQADLMPEPAPETEAE